MDFTKRQREIIDASIRIIAERGIQELTIKNLSRIIGISEPALYRHFESKIAILQGILAFFASRSRSAFEKAVGSGMSAADQLRAVLTAHFDQFARYPSLSAVLFSEEIFQNDRRLSEMVLDIMDTGQFYLRNIIQRGIAEGEFRNDVPAEHLMIAVMGSLRLIVTKWRLSSYGFDLRQEGGTLGESLLLLLASPAGRPATGGKR